MNILAFDTCFGAVSVAVRWRSARGEWLLREAYEARTTGHAERLFPMIAEVMEGAGLAFSAIDRIAVTLGPGTFTGVRVGIAAARAFALPRESPSSARPASPSWRTGPTSCLGAERAGWPLAVAVDARRDMVYFQLFADLAVATGEALLATPEQAASAIGSSPCSLSARERPRSRQRRAPRPRLDCLTCNRMHGRLRSWLPTLRRSTE